MNAQNVICFAIGDDFDKAVRLTVHERFANRLKRKFAYFNAFPLRLRLTLCQAVMKQWD